ncbi:MAG: beta-galactosidase [Thermomicrobiales bacterium]
MTDQTNLIDQRETFALGVCFYPEHWPRDRWESYARQMRELGIGYVRIAEFAWSRMEPRRDEFDWQWLDEAIEVLAHEGLKVVLCTPTATPPACLIHAHPEILPVDIHGHVRNFGSRRHYEPASEVYRAESRRITTAMAERYGEHPAVVGWQTDNEFGCHQTTRSYGEISRRGFQEWLRERYADDLDALNDAWGNVFWSQEYSAWEEIGLPHNLPAQPNPSHLLDFYRYRSDVMVRFQEEQVEILRKLSPGRWVTHNFMRFFDEFDHYQAAECLDFASWDSYPTGGNELSWLSPEEKIRWARTGDPDFIAFNHDLFRGLKGENRSPWVMEQQAGQINWAPYNPLPAQGAVALWTAQGYAHGCDVVSYFRWRAATAAQELMHSGLLRHDETLDRGGVEIAALELPGRPNAPVTARVVLLHDYESLWAYDAQPHNADASYWRQMMLFYAALRELGVDVDIRHPDHDLSGYDLVVAPAIQLVGQERARHLANTAHDALLLVGPRTGYRTPTGRVHEDGQPGPLTTLLGCKLKNIDSMRPGLSCHVTAIPPSPIAMGEGLGVRAEVWAESYALHGGAATHSYSDGPMAGEAAVVRHGNAVTLGAWSPDLIREVIAGLLAERGIPHQHLPEGVRVARRGGTETWMNFNQAPATLPDGSTLGPVSFEVRLSAT